MSVKPSGTGIKAAFDRALRQHPPSSYWLSDALPLLRTQIIGQEGSPDQLPGQPADHDLVRPRQRFETRGEIRRLSGDGS